MADTFHRLLHAEELRGFLADLETARLCEEPLDTRVRLSHAAGHTIWVHVCAVHTKTATGNSAAS